MAYVILYAESARRWAGKHAEFSSALRAYARGRLPGFATPEWVVVVEELPVRLLHLRMSLCVCAAVLKLVIPTQKTSTGKIMKTVLRKRAASAKL